MRGAWYWESRKLRGYSAFALQLRANATSTPAPTVQHHRGERLPARLSELIRRSYDSCAGGAGRI